MAWVKRNAQGAIVTMFGGGPNASEGATEEIANDAQELRDFHDQLFVRPVVQISDRQFFQMLAMMGIITQQEALDAVKIGAIPNPLLAIIDPLPAEEKFAAEMLLSGATIFRRDHALTTAIGTAHGMTEQQVDEFFAAAAQL